MMLSHNPIVEPFALAHATIVTGDKAGTILRNMTIVVGADQCAYPSVLPRQAAQSEAGDAQRPTYGRHIRAFAIGQAVHGRNRKTQRHNIAGVRRYDDPHAWRRGI